MDIDDIKSEQPSLLFMEDEEILDLEESEERNEAQAQALRSSSRSSPHSFSSPPLKKHKSKLIRLETEEGVYVELTEDQFNHLNIPYFQAFRNFSEFISPTPCITLHCPSVPSTYQGAWKTVLYQLNGSKVQIYDKNHLFQTYLLYDYIYSSFDHHHVKAFFDLVCNCWKLWKAHEFTIEGIEGWIQLCDVASKDTRINNQFTWPSRKYLFEYLFCIPTKIREEKSEKKTDVVPDTDVVVPDTDVVVPDTDVVVPDTDVVPDTEQWLYANYQDVLFKAQRYDLLIEHSHSLIRIPGDLGKASTRAIPLPENFHSYLQTLSQSQWQHVLPFLGPSCFFSGGALVMAALNLQTPATPTMDLDFWVSDEDTLFRILQVFETHYSKVFYLVNQSVVSVLVDGLTRPMQFIYNTKRPWEIVDSFDLDYVKVYYDGKELRVCPEVFEAWEQRTILRSSSLVRADRIRKAEQKGFKVVKPMNTKPYYKTDEDYFFPDTKRYSTSYILNALQRFHITWKVFDTLQNLKDTWSGKAFNAEESQYHIVPIPYEEMIHRMNALTLLPPTRNSLGATISALNHPILIRMKQIKVPFGFQAHGDSESQNNPQRLTAFFNLKTDELLYKFFQALNTHIIGKMAENSRDYFKRNLSVEAVAFRFHDGGYGSNDQQIKKYGGPLYRAHVRKNTQIYSYRGEKLDLNHLLDPKYRNAVVDMDLVISKVWFSSLACGLMKNIEKMTLYPPVPTGMGYTKIGILYETQ